MTKERKQATGKELDELWEQLGREFLADNDNDEPCEAVIDLWKKGIPAFFSDDEYPGEVIKNYPDGRREIVTLDDNDNEVVIKKLPNRTTHLY